jgi:hypothetical protein
VKKQEKAVLVQREAIIELLTDDEVSKVSAVEAAARLDEGDEFVDLDMLDRGIQRADGVPVHMGSVLARKVVHEQTWSRIAKVLNDPDGKTPTA